MERIYYFNPAHDMALANNSPYYKAPTEIERMAYDLAVLPAWYGEKGKIKVGQLQQVELLHLQIAHKELLPDVAWTCKWESGEYMPWGWDAAMLYLLRANGVDASCLPTDEQIAKIRYLSGRQRCVEVLGKMKNIPGICGDMKICQSLSEVHFYMSDMGDIVLKSPWSGSGRGVMKVNALTWSDSVEGWIKRVLRSQGEIMVEPLFDKICDFAMEFFADGSGIVSFVGYSWFETDTYGNYKENRLCSDRRIEQMLAVYVSIATLQRVKFVLTEQLSFLLGENFRGYLGVDMMICRVNGRYRFHPCVEINLRMNMGIVSHIIYEKYVHSLSEGYFRIEHYSRDEEAVKTHESMKMRYPLYIADGKIVKGYLSLTGIDTKTRYQVYILIDT